MQTAQRLVGLTESVIREMTRLAEQLQGVDNATVAVKEWEGEVIFLHEVVRGAADRSYGVQVARLAGLPSAVVERARQVLERLEKGDRRGSRHPDDLFDDLPLFSARPVAEKSVSSPGKSGLERRVEALNPDELTPREAMDLLYELKALTTSESN